MHARSCGTAIQAVSSPSTHPPRGTRQVRAPAQERGEAIPVTPLGGWAGGRSPREHQMPALLSDVKKLP